MPLGLALPPGGLEPHRDHVAAGPQGTGDRHLVAPVHVARRRDLDVVDPHGGDGVQPVEREEHLLAGDHLVVQVPLVDPGTRPIQSTASSLRSRYGSGMRPAASRSVCTVPGTVAGIGSAPHFGGTAESRTFGEAERPAVVEGGALDHEFSCPRGNGRCSRTAHLDPT